MTERSTISRHDVVVFQVLKRHRGEWLSNVQIGEEAEDVSPRTVRAVTRSLVRCGLVDQAELFPQYRYRLAEGGGDRGYLDQLTRAAEILGV
jgi:hypothetical protein